MRAFKTVVIAFGFATLLAPVAALAAESEALTAATDARTRESTEIDKAYKAATRGDTATAAKVDPWATVRPAGSDKKPDKKAKH
ncbi:MAG TPA: hypothetical protein VGG01_11230 [Xanthobacteraceae bacterium]|jgi:hypothetical protein